jgi:uncharacterized membrane protein YqhA
VMKHVLRFAIGLISLILILDALVLVVRGTLLTAEAYHNALTRPDMERPLLPALEAVDLFFMGLAFFIVSIGLAQLFVGDLPFLRHVSFAWLRIESFGQLKMLLWDTFLVTMLVLFVTRLASAHTIGWEMLIMPAAILMLSIGSFLLKQKH